jgi:lantibiotic modifying enzyme
MGIAMTLASAGAADRSYLDAARQAARWIASSAIRSDRGVFWPSDPRDAATANRTLYSGSPGVVLFLLEMHRATKEPVYLDDARAGADVLMASLDAETGTGLYEGLAGIGFTLHEVFRATGDPRYRSGTVKVAELLRQRAKAAGRGIEWDGTTDIIAGSAGTGLFLLYAARELEAPAYREVARQAGERLLELARPEAGGLKWAMSPTFPRLMPNFSHGTAGIAYFLATLYQQTKDRRFLEAALGGGRYLQAVAKTEGDTCLIFHDEPDNQDLFYLGWCHGPAGTARTFYRLYQATGDRQWLEWTKRCARALMTSGIPEKRTTPGFWNNVGQCCGSAGIADFLFGLHRATGDRAYLEFARRITADLLHRGSRDQAGLRWVQAENRTQPDLLVAQTGLMQGAAGIGLWLLRLDALDTGRPDTLRLPDSPF